MPKKLSQEDQGRVRAYLENLSNIYGVSILLTVCADCGAVCGVKDGQGIAGISHTMRCDNCGGIAGKE